MIEIIKQVSKELQPLFITKRQIDEKICNAHKKIWKIANKDTDNDKR